MFKHSEILRELQFWSVWYSKKLHASGMNCLRDRSESNQKIWLAVETGNQLPWQLWHLNVDWQWLIHIIHTYIHACMHAYIHSYIHTCIHTYIHACMHAYIHIIWHDDMMTSHGEKKSLCAFGRWGDQWWSVPWLVDNFFALSFPFWKSQWSWHLRWTCSWAEL